MVFLPIISELGRLRQEDHCEFEASLALGYRLRPCHKNKTGWAVVAPVLIPALRQRQADLSEYEASLIYKGGPGHPELLQGETVSKSKAKNPKLVSGLQH